MLTAHIRYKGDPSVGIMSASWEVADIEEFDSGAHREQAREALLTFAVISASDDLDWISVTFSDEFNKYSD